jgi:hypothetical protein
MRTRKITGADPFAATLGSIQTRVELHGQQREEKKRTIRTQTKNYSVIKN